ncbi:type I methionyl aminopeptidase [Longispora albida]|uniref:type I methionyl aminopeptidase n=1 Tax=Longispora albida TaxID=203523 RepID=UPI000365D6F8|nr:type I methionyl aminopeptidase [Longispora albida]
MYGDEIEYKTPEQFRKMRVAGLLVADTLAKLRAAVRPGISTGELDELAEENIRSQGGIPSFKGYHGFPATICASVNEQVVHGIPRKTQVLKDGDLISIDCGAIVDGWHGDSAITVPVGEVRPELLTMIEAAEAGMWAGIAAAKDGGRLSDIGHAVETGVRTVGKYGTVRGYGGHGIGTEMHQDPHVHNYGRPGRGPALKAGMALAIEPMITEGSAKVVELNDGWTVVTKDASMAVHVEHSIAILEDGVWVLTAADGGASRLPAELLSAAARA